MKLMQIRTYWDADDAYAVITFLDELREVLLAVYADEIGELKSEKSLKQEHLSYDDKLKASDTI
ncbi:MAG: hypothetical protein JKY67_18345 [Pseudomonadales bacterium]|nr:hypothetical protein [Pseudomonadales bacterium]MBL4868331.1 hypothetical protein [Pseudomonadales bacterium]